ncbi:MAG: hypothetical protein HKN70_13150, partial [Gammaproteobacteria bacterium]|nr:hypothetical protein [Woeseiaceae bacterium]NNF17684.1 hypothetical protein [Gammaproteobacteria bacterium]
AYPQDADGVYTLGTGAAPFDQSFYLLLSLAVGSNAGGGSTFPQVLEIDAVRVYECANAIDPVAGTGCSTGTGVPAVVAPGEPYTDMLAVYTDAPATVTFVDPADPGNPVSSALVPDTATSNGTVTVNSNIAAADGANTVWNVDINATSGVGSVFMRAPDLSPSTGFFNLSGSETAGELLFRMRVTSALPGTVVEVGLDSTAGNGRQAIPVTADSTWRQYSVKVNDLVTNSALRGTSLDLASVLNLFTVEASTGAITFDLDDIEVVVACRDTGACETSGRISTPVVTTIYGPQDFENIDIMSDVIGDGWSFFINVFDDVAGYLFGYPGAAPNGPQISAIAADQGGPNQGAQQLSIYSDYDCCAGGGPGGSPSGHQSATGLVETNVFQEPRGVGATSISADDVGDTWTFTFDAKRGNIEGSSQALAFFKVLNPSTGFSQTAFVTAEMTNTPVDWTPYSLQITIGEWTGQLLQFGFQTNARNFEGSGIFYDNIEVTSTPGP